MDSLKFCDVRVEKSNSISKYRKIQRITALFRLVELFVFLIIVVRFCSQFPFSVMFSGEHFRSVLVTLISPRFVFVIGNLIVAVLLLKSWRFSAENGGKWTDFYDEYVEKCRRNHRTSSNGKLRDMEMNRSKSEKIPRVSQVEEPRRELRRSTTERCQRTVKAGRRNAAANSGITSYCPEDEMSGEEFRQAVEAFIARQQRLLREEEALSDV
ncbi:uncharacterized protein LOC142506036 [Primulina tabacum]|uniref:uncharacterized protein LOC142506036 n=1 Tax=Primulina tabacum TaxID=48773 RepID=UPI003F5A2FD8